MLFTKDEFKQITQQNPNKSPQSIMDQLLKDGHQLEGFNDSSDGQTAQPQEKSFMEKQFSSEGKTPGQNLALGVAKSATSLVQGTVNLAKRGLDYTAEKIAGVEPQPFKEAKIFPEYMTKTEGAGQTIGKLAGDIGTFFVPGGAVLKGAKIAEAGIAATNLASKAGKVGELSAKALNLLSKSAISAIEAGGITAAQTGSIEEGKTGAKIGAAVPIIGGILGKVTQAVGASSEALAKQIEKVNLRLTPVQKRNLGKKLDDVVEFMTNNKITGNPEQRFQKVDELYNAAEEQISSFIKKYAPTVKADTNQIIDGVKTIIGKYKNNRDIIAIEKQVNEFIDLLNTRYKDGIPLDALNELKRSTFKGAYNKAGEKVLDSIEHEIGGVLNKNVQSITNGLKVAGQDIKSFNNGYGILIESKKLLDIARTRPELGMVGKLVSASVGGAIGTAVGGGVGTALGILAGQTGGKLVAGTAARSQVEKLLMKLSKIGKITESSAGTIKNFLFGGKGKKINLSPKEQKIADKITEYINKPKVGASIYEQPNAIQEAIRQTEKNIEALKARGIKESDPQFKAILKQLAKLRNK